MEQTLNKSWLNAGLGDVRVKEEAILSVDL